MKKFCFIFFLFFSCISSSIFSQSQEYWHGKERILRYHPEGNDFVITNGNRRFTRALYGTHTAFRVEAGDLPEFALYLPGMGGNIKFGLIKNDSSKWLIHADTITARYRPGSMLYEIEDAMLGKGKMFISVLAMADAEGVVIKINFENVKDKVHLFWAYGGVTGKKFSRDGDMGADPESVFYLKPEYCKGNNYTITKNEFLLHYGNNETQSIAGIVPPEPEIKIANAAAQQSPLLLYNSAAGSTPLVSGKLIITNNDPFYVALAKNDSSTNISYKKLPAIFDSAEAARRKLAGRIKVSTPDAYINTIGGAISIAADAIWEPPSYLHGAVGWRMRLDGWRGAYAADVLGWHDRARLHFRSYALSQLTTPDSGKIVADTALHLARQLEKLGTSLYSSGYICRNPGGDFRPHHYDMNLVFIDELLWHFNWTGDTAFVKEMWPLIKRHLAWEKRNFDPDDDGLYDAYAAIWASDALQYSGGGVTHSSAYNYRANKMAAQLAILIGEDGTPYNNEANKIITAINKELWMKDKGWYAEYKDALGLQKLHTAAALWTIYHSIDSDVPDPFQAYQSLQYIDNNIPHIPIKAKGLPDGFYTLSTTNWMPYTWSLNNVVLAELMHTSLAYWEGGRNEEAFKLLESSLLESMYLGGSPGNFQQISDYDAIRGESYRDFADPVGMAARSLIQGLFGILPDALNNKLVIKPGFPSAWNHAALQTPDIKFDFKRAGSKDIYTIIPSFEKQLDLKLLVKANAFSLNSITVNGKKTFWKNIDSAIAVPLIEVNAGVQKEYHIIIEWHGNKIDTAEAYKTYIKESPVNISFPNMQIISVYDPQKLLQQVEISQNHLHAIVTKNTGNKTAFIKVKQGAFLFWKPLNIRVKEAAEIIASTQQKRNALQFKIYNNSNASINGKVVVNAGENSFEESLNIPANSFSKNIIVPSNKIIAGSNEVLFTWGKQADKKNIHEKIINWNVDVAPGGKIEMVSLEKYFNDKVTNIFKNKYLSPRPAVVTLQLPTQGIGDWTHPLLTANIDDAGFRKSAINNVVSLPQKIFFKTPSDTSLSNIIFTSQWDNYPKQIAIPLSGHASHAYLLMAGSTNTMQSQFINGAVIVTYTDTTADTLLLKNPETWWPVEQDYFDDGYAFKTKAAKPVRIHLKTGKIISDYDNSIEEYNGKMIDGGAATVLDLTLKKNKTLQYLKLQTLANDVVIGLMGITLIR